MVPLRWRGTRRRQQGQMLRQTRSGLAGLLCGRGSQSYAVPTGCALSPQLRSRLNKSNLPLMSSPRPPGRPGQWHALRGLGGGCGGSPSAPTLISPRRDPAAWRALYRLHSELAAKRRAQGNSICSKRAPWLASRRCSGCLACTLGPQYTPSPWKGPLSLLAGAKTGSKELNHLPKVTRPQSWHSPKSAQTCLVAKLFPGRLTGSDLGLRLHLSPARREFGSHVRLWNREEENPVGGLGAGGAGVSWFARGRTGELKSYTGACKLLARPSVCLRAKSERGGLRRQTRNASASACVRQRGVTAPGALRCAFSPAPPHRIKSLRLTRRWLPSARAGARLTLSAPTRGSPGWVVRSRVLCTCRSCRGFFSQPRA